MPIDELNSFIREIIPQIGLDHAKTFVYPLSAFLVLGGTDPRIQPIIARGLTQEGVRSVLNTLLSHDSTLSKYCKNSDDLGRTLDILFFRKLSPFAYPEYPEGFKFGGDPVENALSDLHKELYELEFKKTAYFHLFNLFHTGELSLEPPYPGWRIIQLEMTSVAPLLGEATPASFLSPHHAGTLFLISEDAEGFDKETLQDWLIRRWKDAAAYRQVLQYSFDGIVDIDYVVPHFSPEWLNEVHRHGLYYWGAPRQDQVAFNLRHILTPVDQAEINKMLRLYVRHQDKLASKGKTLRKAIRIAGQFFEEFHRKTSRSEQLANLIIALEALFTTGEQSEQTYRISQNCALLVSADSTESKEVFNFLKIMFRCRGQLFHGQYDTLTEKQGEFVTDDQILRLLSLVRQSILKFLTLYIKGEDNLESVRRSLQEAVFDEDVRETLRDNSDPQKL
ncbi:MAG: hypothetical protein ABIU05_03320 [Nitrospirales bacterium]